MPYVIVQAPNPHDESLRELLSAAPGVTFNEDRGLMVRMFTVSGSAESLAAVQPKIDAWAHDCLSRDAW